MRFLLDHNVPAAVGVALADRGHDVRVVTDILPQNAEDPIVAAAAVSEGRILVSHDRDMRRVERLISDGYRDRFPNLSRLHMSCNEVASAHRISEFIEVVEVEFGILSARGCAMIVDLGERRMRLIR